MSTVAGSDHHSHTAPIKIASKTKTSRGRKNFISCESCHKKAPKHKMNCRGFCAGYRPVLTWRAWIQPMTYRELSAQALAEQDYDGFLNELGTSLRDGR